MSVRGGLLVFVTSWAANFVGARALDTLGLIEGLLSPGGARSWLLVPLAGLFFVARFCALFVAPGLLLAALVAKLRRHTAL